MGKPKGRGRKRKGFDLSRPLFSVVLSIVSLAFLGAALITESVLLLAVTGLSVLATVAQVQMARKRAEQQRKKAAMPLRVRKPRKPAGATRPTPAAADAPAGGLISCTETGQDIESCGCASRHVATAEGARRYGLRVGSPIGKRQKAGKPPMTRSSAAV